MLEKIRLAIVDDHVLFREGLKSLIEKLSPEYDIIFEASNGLEMQTLLKIKSLPDIILLDMNMPGMDGLESVDWLKEHHPDIKIIVVSMVAEEESIVGVLKKGVMGYVSKDVEPEILDKAIRTVYNGNFYYTDLITGKLIDALKNKDEEALTGNSWNINDRELTFIRLACSEMTYQQIAGEMFLSPKTIDGYRKSLFEKLNVKSRVGLVMFSIKQGLVEI